MKVALSVHTTLIFWHQNLLCSKFARLHYLRQKVVLQRRYKSLFRIEAEKHEINRTYVEYEDGILLLPWPVLSFLHIKTHIYFPCWARKELMYFGCGEEMVFVARACPGTGLQCYKHCHKYLIRQFTLNKKKQFQ